jgi:CARDB
MKKTLLTLSALLASMPAKADVITATSIRALTDTFAVNTRMKDRWNNGAYTNVTGVESELSYLGIRHIRELFNDDGTVTILRKIHQDLGATYNVMMQGDQYSAVMNRITANADMVEAVEGANEVDVFPPNFQGNTGLYAAVLEQKQLRQDLKANPNTANKPLYSLSLTNPGSTLPVIGNISPYADQVTSHIYPQWYGLGGESTYDVIGWIMQEMDPMAPGEPNVVTEGGWWTQPFYSGVTEAAQAKLTLAFLLDEYAQGVTRTYLWQLVDEYSDPQGTDIEQHYGLFRNDGSAKPVATALHNMNAILADTGTLSNPGTLSYALANLPATGHKLVFQRSDGVFIVALWNNISIWDNTAYRERPETPSWVTLTPTSPSSMAVYDPFVGVNPITSVSGQPSIQFNLWSHPVFVFIGGGSATPPTNLPDLIPTSLSYNTTTGLFTSVVTNQGSAATPAGVIVGVSYSVDGVQHTWGTVAGPLAAGASVTIGTNGGAYAIPSGTHTITAFADDVNRIAESNETNNTLSQTITVP